MAEKAEKKPETKAPVPLCCSDCGRTKGEDGVTIYAKKCSICRATSKKAKPPEPETKKSGGETKPPGPETNGPVLTKESCHLDKKSPGEPLLGSQMASAEIVKTRYVAPAAPSDDAITVSVDFTRYPNIHSRLLKLAEEEFRTPANQLLYLLHDHLEGLEERAADKQEGAADGR